MEEAADSRAGRREKAASVCSQCTVLNGINMLQHNSLSLLDIYTKYR